jgi:hypothetical protein
LDGERDSEGPFGSAVKKSLYYASSDELTYDPGEIDIGCQVSTDLQWSDLRGVGGGESLEDTPRNALKDLASEEGRKVLGKEGYEDENYHEDERAKHGLLIPDLVGNIPIKVQADGRTTLTTGTKIGLPIRRYDLRPWWGAFAGVGLVTETLLKSKKVRPRYLRIIVENYLRCEAIKVAHERSVVTLHDNGGREDDGKGNGLRIETEAFTQAHGVLPLRGGSSVDVLGGDVWVGNAHLMDMGIRNA